MAISAHPPVEVTELRADVLVIGAGLAGLTAASILTRSGIEVLVVEARERVGGRTWTQPANNGLLLDLGGQWIGPSQHRIAALAESLGLTTFPTYDTGLNIEYRAGTRNTYSGAIPTFDPITALDTVEAMLELNLMANEVPLDAPWEAEKALTWDSQTFGSWIEQNIQNPNVRTLLELATQAVFSTEPRDLSLLHVLFYTHSGGSLNELISVTRGAQESRFHAGAQSISNRLAETLGERVILNSPVRAIHYSSNGVQAALAGKTLRARKAIIAISPTLAGRIDYQPALPGLRDQLTQRMPMGTVIKIQCIYQTPFWRKEGYSGQATSDTGAVRITFDNSPEDGSSGVLLAFIEGDQGRIWGAASTEDRRAAALDNLTLYFGEQARQPIEYMEVDWAGQEFSRGGYAGYMSPGAWTSYGKALREPIGPLHWAGTETATVWNGYMDGAVQSGERAAAEVLAALQGGS
ncbi:MAG TPA: flavin monoamine oxidase family protein [Ktedonobacteraceae bacterium]|nr:flavin monoamine oxidase family protein [Ktedonobacteraceae bacterium]